MIHRLFALLFLFTGTAAADDFKTCLGNLTAEADSVGLQGPAVDNALRSVEYLPKVIELDRRQPEFSSTFARYLSLRVSDTRIERGRKLYAEHRPLLDRLTREYSIPGAYLVSFWGLETNFGSYLGNMPALSALATLACDERRSAFFSTEFLTALKLVQENNLDSERMVGSWAGAMGQTQFMPSTYLRYAVDGDGDGRIDLWHSTPDALASAANFLAQLGWEPGLRWGREVLLPENFDWRMAGRRNTQPLSHWRRVGVRRADGGLLPQRDDIHGAIIVPAGHKGPAFIAYRNFNVIMGWNRSEFYAISVGHLADRIAGAGDLRVAPPADAPRLSRAQIKAMQARLNEMGFNAGPADGIMGSGTRSALRAWQASRGMIADGFASQDVVNALIGGSPQA